MFNVKVSRKVKKEKKIGTNRIFSPEKLIRSYTSNLHGQRQSFEKGKERKAARSLCIYIRTDIISRSWSITMLSLYLWLPIFLDGNTNMP